MSIRETVRSLDIAARSIVETQAIAGTVAGVIAERALDHHWEGLYQYAAIRTGPETAVKVLDQLVHQVEEARPDKDQALTPQADLYKRLRSLVAAAPAAMMTADAAAWWSPADASLRRGLTELRRTLSA